MAKCAVQVCEVVAAWDRVARCEGDVLDVWKAVKDLPAKERDEALAVTWRAVHEAEAAAIALSGDFGRTLAKANGVRLLDW